RRPGGSEVAGQPPPPPRTVAGGGLRRAPPGGAKGVRPLPLAELIPRAEPRPGALARRFRGVTHRITLTRRVPMQHPVPPARGTQGCRRVSPSCDPGLLLVGTSPHS